VFAIDICAYAIMSNHYHLVVRVDQKRVESWSPQEVVERWCLLFSRPTIIDRWLQGTCGDVERAVAEGVIELWRRQLFDVSWYMRCLNEHLARRANAEDECTGRFWEGRFKSQALLDEAGLLTAMAYVDLNPIRAAIAETPEEAEFTSVYERIKRLNGSARAQTSSDSSSAPVALPLLDFRTRSNVPGVIPFSLHDYLELIDWTGRMQRTDKRGAIDSAKPRILNHLNLDPAAWCHAMRPGGNFFGRAIGRVDHMRLHAQMLQQAWIRGTSQAERLFA
jgi:hypothetical protein